MQVHKLVQGSDDWNQFRLNHFGASEAAAMLGLSTKMKRNELLHMKHTMQPKEFSDWVENVLFAGGHEAEELARPIIEGEDIGDDLYPVTCSDGMLSASCDGLTLNGLVAWEHKIWNSNLAEDVSNNILPDEYMPQCQQILMITGARKIFFTCSDGTDKNMATTTVYPDKKWFKRITAGWEQFMHDLAEYVPRGLTEKPQASVIMQLPALSIQIKGEVIASNLPAFKAEAETFIANINTELKTDDDFSNAEATVKYCDETEKKLEAAKKAAIAQTASIEEVMNTIDFIKDQLRTKRLDLEKKVKTEKANIKAKIIKDARDLFNIRVNALNDEFLGVVQLIIDMPNFDAVMKNKRTLESLHNAVDTELSRCTIIANEVCLKISKNLKWLNKEAEGYASLFPDQQTIIYKDIEDFRLLVNARIINHKNQVAEAAANKIIDDAVVAEKVKEATPHIGHFQKENKPGVLESIQSFPKEDDKHKESIHASILTSLIISGFDETSANHFLKKLIAGKIDNVTINY